MSGAEIIAFSMVGILLIALSMHAVNWVGETLSDLIDALLDML